MKALAKTTILLFLGLSFNSFSQLSKTTPFVDWTTADGSQQVYKQNCMVHNPNGNGYTYIAGANYLNGYYDLMVTKIDADGAIVWSKVYGSSNSGDDAASAIFVDENDDVYVCGTTFIDSTNFNDFVLIKYQSNGTLDWDATYNADGSYYDGAIDMVYDQANQFIYVVGTGFNGNLDLDFITLQYDPSGNLQWNAYYDANGDDDVAARVLTDGNSVYVTGACKYQQWDWRTVIVEYDNGGSYVNHDSTAAGSITGDVIGDFFRDTIGNIYITGSRNDTSSYNYFTIKYDTLLSNQWSNTYNAPHGGNDYATGVWVDYDGNVYVTGAATDTINGYDIHTLKYNASGNLVWTKTWNDATYNGNDSAVAIIGDTLGNLYIIASSYHGYNRDYLILKYDTAGNELWNIAYNGLDNGDDIPAVIAIEPTTNDIYITGTVEENTGLTYLTLRLKEIDVILPQDSSRQANTWDYTANLGQLVKTDTSLATNVIYYTNESSTGIYFQNNAFSYVCSRQDTSGANDSLHRVDMIFETENSTKPRGYNRKSFYTNHYLGYLPESRAKVPHYSNLLYSEVWNYIDIECGSDAYGFKYFINVKPNGNVANIQFLFSGHDTLIVDGSGNLLIITSLDTIVQPKPAAWEIDNSGTKTNLGWTASYSISGNIVSLTLGGTYTSTKTLVLGVGWQPRQLSTPGGAAGLCWSTYFGGSNGENVYAIDADALGNSFITGETRSGQSTFPITPGAAQPTFFGSQQCFVAKFKPDFFNDWTTYYGGSDDQAAYDISIRDNNNVYICGFTRSNDLTPGFKLGAYNDNSLASLQNDGFLAQFNYGGFLQWSTYFGGTGADLNYSIDFDLAKNLYLLGEAGGSTNFPTQTLSGAYTQSFGGSGDAFIAKFNSSDSLVWCSFYGGSSSDFASTVKTDKFNNVYIAGYTYSSDFPTLKTSFNTHFDNTLSGSTDHYIAKFSNAGQQLWSTYIGGSSDEFTVSPTNRIAFDSNGDMFTLGKTNSNDFPLSSYGVAFYDTSFATNSGYIMKFSNSINQLLWSSYYSGSGNLDLNSIAIDASNKVYVAGATTDTSLTTKSQTGVYYQPNLIGNYSPFEQDGFIAVFNRDIELSYASYFGGYEESTENIRDIAVGGTKLFYTGTTTTSDTNSIAKFPLYNPGTPAYYDSTYNGGFRDMFVAMICADNITSINEKEVTLSKSFTLYPNPAKENIEIKFGEKLEKELKMEIYSIDGRRVKEEIIPSNTLSYTININNLTTGMYIITANTKQLQAIKFIKQ